MVFVYLCKDMRLYTIKQTILGLTATMLLSGCGAFDIHPYDVDVKGATSINSRNIRQIEQATQGKDTLRFACISDTHQWYTDMRDALNDINRRKDSIDFVVHCGDLTDTGTNKEFEWCDRVMSNLQLPYVAMIGNHDFLGTGEEYYVKKYGTKNLSMIAGRVKFVFLNTNATEYDHVASVPDLNYIRQQAEEDTDKFDRTIVLMHARPYSDQFNNNIAEPFEYYLQNFLKPMCCINGHDHSTKIDDIFNDGLIYYGLPSVVKRKYLIFTITPNSYRYEIVDF